MEDKKVAYSYIRFSSGSQAKGTSVERQQELIEEWLNINPDYQLSDRSFQDLGLSGFSGAHKTKGAFGTFLSGIEKGVIERDSVLLVETFDRLGRLDTKEMLKIIIDIVEAGVQIITLEDKQCYGGESFSEGKAYVLITKIQAAHDYSKRLSERVSKGKENSREALLAGNKKIYTKICPAWLRFDGNNFVVIPERVEVVKKIFKLYVDEGLGTTAIANRLNTENVPLFTQKTKRQRKSDGWYDSYINKILFSTKVIGQLTFNHRSKDEGEKSVISDYYPKVVEESIFLKAQAIKKSKFKGFKQRKPDSRRPVDIYINKIKCHCGSEVKLQNKNKGYFVYRCKEAIKKKCDSPAIKINEILFHVGGFISQKLIDYVKQQTGLIKSNSERVKEQLSAIQKDKNKHLIAIKKMNDALFEDADLISEEEEKSIKQRLNKVRKEVKRIDIQIKALEQQKNTETIATDISPMMLLKYWLDWDFYLSDDKNRVLSPLDYSNLKTFIEMQNLTVIINKSGFKIINASNIELLTFTKNKNRARAGCSVLSNKHSFINKEGDFYKIVFQSHSEVQDKLKAELSLAGIENRVPLVTNVSRIRSKNTNKKVNDKNIPTKTHQNELYIKSNTVLTNI